MKKLINVAESTEELLCNPCAEQTKPELDDDQKLKPAPSGGTCEYCSRKESEFDSQ